jgi:hypothetical protein
VGRPYRTSARAVSRRANNDGRTTLSGRRSLHFSPKGDRRNFETLPHSFALK